MLRGELEFLSSEFNIRFFEKKNVGKNGAYSKIN